MSKIEQQVGGPADNENLYTGPARQLTIDVSNWDIRLHDGSTPGGRIIPNRDNNDVRYQARAPELDGLIDFNPFARGILVRVGPADYRLRSIQVNTGNLAITNPAGFDGNPYIELADQITTQHNWTLLQSFDGGIIAAGGIKADVEGDLTGDVLGDSQGTHTGPVVGNVQGNLVGNSTGTHTGDVDVRGHTLSLDDGQIHLAALNDDVGDFIRASIPQGVILMWSGLIEDIPDGWLLCDGTAGTPDLRNRFIVGAGDIYLEDDTGGADSYALTGTAAVSDHTHVVDVGDTALSILQIPSHNHGNGVADDTAGFQRMWRGTQLIGSLSGNSIKDGGGLGTPIEGISQSVGGGLSHTHTGDTQDAGAESAAVSIPDQSLLPPYYALAYIKKGF